MNAAARERGVRRAIEADQLRDWEIAAYFGIARETVSRIRSRMRREALTVSGASEGER